MEIITKTPGFQHIVEKSLMCLNRKSIAIFRSVNRDCKGITDSPSFYLKKLSQENLPQDLIENWKQLIKNIPSEEIKQVLTSEIIQMYAKRSPKYPLELAQELALDKKDSELLVFIFEFSSPKIFVEPAQSILSDLSGEVDMDIGNLTVSRMGNLNPIQIATWFGYEKPVERMISTYDYPNAPNSKGITPIHIAAFKGNLKIVQLLIPSATNPHVADIYGLTPIHSAAQEGHLEIVRLLMTSTSNPNVADNYGMTPIHLAAYDGHLEIVRLLMTSTTNVNVADDNGNTPIHFAAQEGHLEMVQLLMKTANNPNASDNFGSTPEYLASIYGHHDIVRLFRNLAIIRSLLEL